MVTCLMLGVVVVVFGGCAYPKNRVDAKPATSAAVIIFGIETSRQK
jgi:hypothetical protein